MMTERRGADAKGRQDQVIGVVDPNRGQRDA
jgi:hypothetical protein